MDLNRKEEKEEKEGRKEGRTHFYINDKNPKYRLGEINPSSAN